MCKKEQRESVYKALSQKLEQLIKDQAASCEKVAGLKGDAKSPDHADRAFAYAEVAKEEEICEKRGKSIYRIRRAIERFDNGWDGTCECGTDIPAERLMAEPGTTHCVDCKEVIERANQLRPPRTAVT